MSEVEEKPRPKCVKGKGYCGGMTDHMADYYARTRRGMICLQLMNRNTGTRPYSSTPCYFSKERPEGTWLNYCPWCGVKYDWGIPLEPAKKKRAKAS